MPLLKRYASLGDGIRVHKLSHRMWQGTLPMLHIWAYAKRAFAGNKRVANYLFPRSIPRLSAPQTTCVCTGDSNRIQETQEVERTHDMMRAGTWLRTLTSISNIARGYIMIYISIDYICTYVQYLLKKTYTLYGRYCVNSNSLHPIVQYLSCHIHEAIIDKSSFYRIIAAMQLCVGFPDV